MDRFGILLSEAFPMKAPSPLSYLSEKGAYGWVPTKFGWAKCLLAVDGDAHVGHDDVSADGGAEEGGRGEDAGEEVLFHAQAHRGIVGAGDDGVVVDAALGVYLGFDEDGDVAVHGDGQRCDFGVEVVRGDEVGEVVVVGLDGDGGAEHPAEAGEQHDGSREAA